MIIRNNVNHGKLNKNTIRNERNTFLCHSRYSYLKFLKNTKKTGHLL